MSIIIGSFIIIKKMKRTYNDIEEPEPLPLPPLKKVAKRGGEEDIPFNRTLEESLSKLIKRGEEAKNKKRYRSVAEYILENDDDDDEEETEKQAGRKRLRAEFNVLGDQTLFDIRTAIRKFPRCTNQQLLFTEVFINSQLQYYYGTDFEAHETRIKQENLIDEIYQYALVNCPRRWGKTYIAAIFAACSLATVPGCKIVVYSPGQRQSMMFMDLVRDRLNDLQGHGYQFEPIVGKNNKENLWVKVDGDTRSVVGLPANSNTVRGTGGTLIICEEAAAMEMKFFNDVVLPVTGVGDASCICISTIQGDSDEGVQNWFTTLLGMTFSDGRPMFNIFRLYQACQACIDAGVAEKCEHLKSELPWWHNQSKQMLVRDIMTKLGCADSAKRELLGVNTSKVKPVYDSKIVRQLFNTQRNPLFRLSSLSEDPALVFVAIDPSMGGDKSNTSLVSMIFHQGQYVIVGGESIAAKIDEQYRPVIMDHVKNLRMLPKLSHATILVAIESNNGMVGRHIMNDIVSLNLPNVLFLIKHGQTLSSSELYRAGGSKSGPFGVRTQGQQGQGNVKEEMVFTLRTALQNEQLKFAHEFLHIHRSGGPDPIKDYKTSVMNQMLAFSMKFAMAKGDFSMTKRTYSGKHGPEGHDDDCTVYGICLYWLIYYRTHREIANI
jgi:hypothetical protein